MQTQQRFYTPEEYLVQEETAEFRSEYRNGEILPMTGGSIEHNKIIVNLCTLLKIASRGKTFKPYIGDLRLWVPHYRQYTYPDVLVIQGEPVFQDQRTDTVLNPCLIIEVLSKSTSDYDREALPERYRSDKFRYYRSIPELQEYVLIDQYEIAIEHYTKVEADAWLFRAYEANAEKIKLVSIEVQMAIADIYEDVTFTSEDAAE